MKSFFTRKETEDSLARRLANLQPTPEEIELFGRLWDEYNQNLSPEREWTAPELENEKVHERWWEWVNVVKILPSHMKDYEYDDDSKEEVA